MWNLLHDVIDLGVTPQSPAVTAQHKARPAGALKGSLNVSGLPVQHKARPTGALSGEANVRNSFTGNATEI